MLWLSLSLLLASLFLLFLMWSGSFYCFAVFIIVADVIVFVVAVVVVAFVVVVPVVAVAVLVAALVVLAGVVIIVVTVVGFVFFCGRVSFFFCRCYCRC